MSEPTYCECGCGEQTNTLHLQVQDLYRSGLTMREVGDKLGIKRTYVKVLLRAEAPRYRKGHAGRVVHMFAGYKTCGHCGREFYSFHGESFCRSDYCSTVVACQERNSLTAEFKSRRADSIAMHRKSRQEVQAQKRDVFSRYHRGEISGRKANRELRSLDRRARRLDADHQKERSHIHTTRQEALDAHWNGFSRRFAPQRAEAHNNIWQTDSDWMNNGGYLAEAMEEPS